MRSFLPLRYVIILRRCTLMWNWIAWVQRRNKFICRIQLAKNFLAREPTLSTSQSSSLKPKVHYANTMACQLESHFTLFALFNMRVHTSSTVSMRFDAIPRWEQDRLWIIFPPKRSSRRNSICICATLGRDDGQLTEICFTLVSYNNITWFMIW